MAASVPEPQRAGYYTLVTYAGSGGGDQQPVISNQ